MMGVIASTLPIAFLTGGIAVERGWLSAFWAAALALLVFWLNLYTSLALRCPRCSQQAYQGRQGRRLVALTCAKCGENLRAVSPVFRLGW